MSILVAYQICAYATNEIKGSTKGFSSIKYMYHVKLESKRKF